MGGWFSRGSKSSNVLVVGLDNSGKSTIINQLKPSREKAAELHATVGFQVEKFRFGNVRFTMFDMSGQGRYRNLWEHYYADTQAIIFVVDSADKVRLCVVKDELDAILQHKDITSGSIPVLFFANKMDLPAAVSAAEISKLLGLDSVTTRAWRIVRSNALTGGGLEEGMKWLSAQIE